MRAMILRNPGPIEKSPLVLESFPEPVPGPGDLLIRVEACGICHTDLHIAEGEISPPSLPIIPGHQIVGSVEYAGEGSGSFRKGARVGVPWLHSTCGRCSYCTSGRENLCSSALFTGFNRHGGFAEFVTAPADFTYPLTADFPAIQAAPLLCAGIIGYRALRLSHIGTGQNLGLYGFGASAHIAIQVALHWNCRVFVFTRSPIHQEHARELGAAWSGDSSDSPHIRMDASIIFAPAGALVPKALEHLARGGTLVLAGIYMTPVPELDYEQHLYYEREIKSVTASTREDARALLSLAAKIPVRTTVLSFPLERANEALQQLKESRFEGAAVLKIGM
jgi:alcohol dehydrogenase, propanol-preferring